jgi:hypothetical protein
MIIDTHAYCFEAFDAAEPGRGWADPAEHLALHRAGNAGHHQPALRLDDALVGDASVLTREDCDFRLDKARGRVVWTHGGRDWTKYFAPPNLLGCEYTAESLDCEMHHAGVDAALLHTDPSLVRDPAYYGEVVRRYPGRLYAMCPTDHPLLLRDPAAAAAAVAAGVGGQGLHGVKFHTNSWYGLTEEPWADGPTAAPYWDAVTALPSAPPVFFTTGWGPRTDHRNTFSSRGQGTPGSEHGGPPGEDELSSGARELAGKTLAGKGNQAQGGPAQAEMQRGFVGEMQMLRRWLDLHPTSTAAITHGFPWRTFLDKDGGLQGMPDGAFAPFETGRCYLEVCFPVRLGDLFDFPYREVWPTLRTLVERVGADRLVFGTDMPFQNRFCTYKQSIKYLQAPQYCPFLTDVQRARILGGSAAELLRIAEPQPSPSSSL